MKTSGIKSNFNYKLMKLIHYNPFLNDLGDPYVLLKSSGLNIGQKILEVGCGAGYYTIPAAELVTETGIIYALDINSQSMQEVQKKKDEKKLKNIILVKRDAVDTGLESKSIDGSFFFGVPRLFRMKEVFSSVFKETFRITKPNGFVSIKSSNKNLISKVEFFGFIFVRKTNKLLIFKKSDK